MSNCIVANNKIQTTTGASQYGAGIGITDSVKKYAKIELGASNQVYNNIADGRESDLYLHKGFKLDVTGGLANGGASFIGIDLEEEFEGEFTRNYNVYNVSLTPSYAFFSNHQNEYADFSSVSNEVYMKTGSTTSDLGTWTFTGDTAISSTGTYIELPYREEGYTITHSFNGESKTFWGSGVPNGSEVATHTFTNVGEYALWSHVNIKNHQFSLVILPKVVDVLWENNEFTYTGLYQKPIAYIAEDSNCKVEVKGEQINSGSHYIATAVSLNNKNYKINPETMNKPFIIKKVKLNKPNGMGSFEYDGTQQIFEPNDFNSATMNIANNAATNVGSYTATISIKDKINYIWADNSYEDITLQYAITLAPPVNEENGVYRFIYLAEEGDKQIRKTYKESGLVHGINDSEVNGGKAVIGNIAPNTSVKEFIETLGFDTSKIVLKDNKGKDIYKNNVPVDIATYDNKYELAVGTGWRVEYTNNGNTETIYLSVLGDVTGDGRISAVDVTYLRQVAKDKEVYDNLSVEKKLASLVLNVGLVTTADAEIIRNIMDNKLDIKLFF